MRAAKVQASLRIRAVSPEPSLLAHTNSESRGTFRQKARSLAPLNGWACAVKICHDGMLEDTNSLDGAQLHLSLNHASFYHFMLNILDLKPRNFCKSTTKPTKWAVHPAKTQISVGIHPVFAVSMKKPWVHIERTAKTDQTAQRCRFLLGTCDFVGFVVQRLIYLWLFLSTLTLAFLA